MPHSHLPVLHLIRQVEERRARRPRDARPNWVTGFIDQVAECFDPHDEVARVGFDCRPEEDAWLISMYLGSTEIVGGREDGIARHAGFHFDITGALKCFAEVHDIRWTPSARRDEENSAAHGSTLTIDGLVDGRPLRLRVASIPPEDAGPAFRKYPDGRRAPA